MKRRFTTKDLGPLKYFPMIEVSHNKEGIVLSQCKHVLYLLQETDVLGTKHVHVPMKSKFIYMMKESNGVNSQS